jgi:hypothetical protein
MTEITPSSDQAPAESEKRILSRPSKALAYRLLRQVNFEKRVMGVKSHSSAGQNWDAIYSFQEATQFMGVSGDWTYYIGSEVLQKWIGDTLGDKELAQAIGEIAKILESCSTSWEREQKEIELITPIRELMEQRLQQAKDVQRSAIKA